MSTKLGNIRTETRSWRPKWPIIGHYFSICVISGKPDQIATIEQNVQFQVGIYHEKFQHEKIQNGRPAATSDRQIFSIIT